MSAQSISLVPQRSLRSENRGPLPSNAVVDTTTTSTAAVLNAIKDTSATTPNLRANRKYHAVLPSNEIKPLASFEDGNNVKVQKVEDARDHNKHKEATRYTFWDLLCSCCKKPETKQVKSEAFPSKVPPSEKNPPLIDITAP